MTNNYELMEMEDPPLALFFWSQMNINIIKHQTNTSLTIQFYEKQSNLNLSVISSL